MNFFYIRKINKYPSIQVIENSLMNFRELKDSRNKLITKSNINTNIRRKNLIRFEFLICTNEINKFSLSGIISKKHKKRNLNNSVTVRSVLSGKEININFHLFSKGTRLV